MCCTSKHPNNLAVVKSSLAQISPRGSQFDVVVNSTLGEEIGIGARIEASATAEVLDVPVPPSDNNVCLLPILGLGNNECPVSKGKTCLGFRGIVPVVILNVCILFLIPVKSTYSHAYKPKMALCKCLRRSKAM